jgi:hypothetical protein
MTLVSLPLLLFVSSSAQNFHFGSAVFPERYKNGRSEPDIPAALGLKIAT